MSWLEEHMETFVRPWLEDTTDQLAPLSYFEPEELTVIKNAWRSVKKSAKHRPILLAGRDVYIFEILARRENYPTTFMPEISRVTVKHLKIPSINEYFLFDTGFVGSIPRNLGMSPTNYSLLSFYERENVRTQTFPRLSFSRGLALKIEKTPKYWKSAHLGNENEIVQEMSHLSEFYDAARLTLEVYKNSSPKFIPDHRPILVKEGGF